MVVSFRVVLTPEVTNEDQKQERLPSIGDIEDLTNVCPAKRFKHNKLSVTDLSAQLWCEKQLEFVLKTGRRRATAAMLEGIARHDELERLDHEVLDVEPASKEESLAFRLLSAVNLLQQLLEKKKLREIWVFGVIDGILLRGIIDEITIERKGPHQSEFVVIADTKTRRAQTEPSDSQKRGTANQLQTYHWMVSTLRDGTADFESLFRLYSVDPEASFVSPYLNGYSNLKELASELIYVSEKLPPMWNEVFVSYECNGVEFAKCGIPVADHLLKYALMDLLNWWNGGRAAEGVMQCESWKCKSCDFVGECQETPLPPDVVQRIVDLQMLKDFDAFDSGLLAEANPPSPSLKTPNNESADPCTPDLSTAADTFPVRRRTRPSSDGAVRKRQAGACQILEDGVVSANQKRFKLVEKVASI